jgi:hypothetical protein
LLIFIGPVALIDSLAAYLTLVRSSEAVTEFVTKGRRKKQRKMSRSRGLASTRPVHPCILNVFDGNHGAEYATWAHIYGDTEQPNLVTAQASTLRIYAVNAASGKLELRDTFSNLAGSICSLDTLSTNSKNDKTSASPTLRDSLLIGFAGHPRLAICSLQAEAPPLTSRAKLLLATSLIDLTPALMDACMGSVTPLEQDLIATLLDRKSVGNEKTLCVVLGGGVAIACLSLVLRRTASTSTQQGEQQWQASEPFILPLGALSKTLSDEGNSSVPKADGAATGAATAVSAYQQTIAHGFGDTWSCCFLAGYLEPTLVLLHSGSLGRTWSGRLGRTADGETSSRYGCRATALSITVPHHQAAVLWSVTVPADAMAVHAVGTKSGCMVQSANSLVHITNGGRISGPALAVNGWAYTTNPPNVVLQPNPWPLPKLAIQLDGARIAIISETLGLVVLRYGAVYLLQQMTGVGGQHQWSMLPLGQTLGSLGQVATLLALPLGEATTDVMLLDKLMMGGKKGGTINMGLLFAGSRLGDSSLLGYTVESGVTLVEAMKPQEPTTDKVGSAGDATIAIAASQIKTEDSEGATNADDDYEGVLQLEEDALYADDAENGNNGYSSGKPTATSEQQAPDIVPPSSDEEDETKTQRTKRAKLARVSVLRSLQALDSLTALGPLGPGCEGPLSISKKQSLSSNAPIVPSSASAAMGGTAKIMPCGQGSSGGLALVTAPGRDDRSILVEEDCLNVQSIFCCNNLILMGMLPTSKNQEQQQQVAGINALRISATSSKSTDVELSQVDMKVWCKSSDSSIADDGAMDTDQDPSDPSFVFNQTNLLAASELPGKKKKNNTDGKFCVVVRVLNADQSYAVVSYKETNGALETLFITALSTGFPSTLLQVSPFLKTGNKNDSTLLFGCVWSLGCAILYTMDSNGDVVKEEQISGQASLIEAEDDDEEVFYQCDRITAMDLFEAPANLFDFQKPSSNGNTTGTNGIHEILGDLDDEDRELYEAFDSKSAAAIDKNTRDGGEPQEDAPSAQFVAVSRQTGQLEIFKVGDLETSIWSAMGCGQGVARLSPLRQEAPRHPRMHKVYSREVRFFVAGSSSGPKDYFFSVSTNLGDVHIYQIAAGDLVRASLRLPARPSKKQTEHHTKLRRRKILPKDAVDDSVMHAKTFYHNQLSRFEDISGHDGLFAATTRPVWFVTERRSLVALSHRSRHVAPGGGKSRPVCGFCPRVMKSAGASGGAGFLTLHERIGRVGSQRLTIFKGISNLFSPLGLMSGSGYCIEKIPMGVTVHRVHFLDDANVSTNEHPLYAVMISREMEVDQSHLNEDGYSAEERQRMKDEKEEAQIKRQVEADLGGFDVEQEWVEEIERENCFEVDTSLGGAPPIRKSVFSIWIVDAANGWNVVDSHELGENEHGLTMKVMYLTEINVDPGKNSSLSDDEIGPDTLFVAVGTGVVDNDGEDVSGKGKVTLFQVKRQEADAIAAGAQIAELSVAYEKDILHGPVTTLSCLTTEGRSRLIIGAGADVNVEQWGKDRLTQVGFFRATMQILDIMLFKNFFVLSDAYDSLYFLVWRESDKSLTLLAKDYEPIPVFAAGLLSRGAAMTFVCHDDRQNLQFFQYAPGDAAGRGGNKLVSRADVHLGAQTISFESHFCRSSILVNSGTPSSTLAALKSQDSLFGRGDDDQRLGVHFGTSDGGFGTILPLNEPDYWRLAALQSVLANALESDCALNPRAWRLFRRTPRRGGCRNNDRQKSVIDGDLVIQYCDLPTADQEDLASAIGSTVELILDNLVELRCASQVI